MGRKIVVIGGVAAGASAAAKARRTDEFAEITVVDKGGHVSFANCGLPYYVGGVIKARQDLLLHTPDTLGRRFNLKVMTNTEAISVDAQNRKVALRTPQGDAELSYDRLILAPGANTFIPPVKGLDNVPFFTMRTVEDVDAIHTHLKTDKPKSALIIGGGYIGVEAAEAMYHCGISTVLVEALPRILPLFAPEATLGVREAMEKAGIDVLTGVAVSEVRNNQGAIDAVLSDGRTLSTDMLLICTGVRPNTALAESAGLKIGQARGIAVDERMQTSDPHIFAAGDAVEKKNLITGARVLLPLAGPANREGRAAGCNAAGGNLVFRGVVGTSILGFLDQTVAQTGIDETTAVAADFDPEVIYTENGHHVEYYPGAQNVFLKIVYDKKSGRILGAAASGKQGVDKRIDVLATAIIAGLTVQDIENLDLCYAPQFGAANDMVHMGGFIAANQIRNVGFGIHPKHFLELSGRNDIQVLDVRTPIEYRMGHVENAIHININDLREQLSKIDKNQSIYAYCAVGYRGYLAAGTLRALGFEAFNVLGGYESIKRFEKLA